MNVPAHQVRRGDEVLGSDGRWRPVLVSFPENAASGTTTVWAIYSHVDGEPTRRLGFGAGDPVTVRRSAP